MWLVLVPSSSAWSSTSPPMPSFLNPLIQLDPNFYPLHLLNNPVFGHLFLLPWLLSWTSPDEVFLDYKLKAIEINRKYLRQGCGIIRYELCYRAIIQTDVQRIDWQTRGKEINELGMNEIKSTRALNKVPSKWWKLTYWFLFLSVLQGEKRFLYSKLQIHLTFIQ